MDKHQKICIQLSLVLLFLFCFSLCVGRFSAHPFALLDLLINQNDPTAKAVLFQIRLPRSLFALVAGGALSLAGLVYQSIFRNPLVSPEVLGVTGGAAVGAIVCIVFGFTTGLFLQISAFALGILAVLFALFLASFVKTNQTLALVLAGIITSSISSSVIMLLKYMADPEKQLGAIEFWLMGGLSTVGYPDFFAFFLIFPCVALLFFLRYPIKVMTLGENEATSLGIDVKQMRFLSLMAATILVSAVIAVAGMISWIGLIGPHIVKQLEGEDFSKNLLPAFLSGACLLLLSDIFAHSFTSAELPISILTSLLGALFLIFLLLKRRKQFEY